MADGTTGVTFRVALTFDAEHADRPAPPGVAEGILDVLATDRVASTVFLQGRWVEAQPRLAARVARDGHLVGNHSHYHARMPMFHAGALAADVRAAEAAIRRVTGSDPRPWFRCPFGSGSSQALVVRRLAALGYRDVAWDVDSRDWANSQPRRVVERVVRGVCDRGDGAVVLLHAWPTTTLAALPAIVARLRREGAAFVRLDALDRLPPSPWIRGSRARRDEQPAGRAE